MTDPSVAARLTTLRTLWLAFCVTPMVFAAIGILAGPDTPADDPLTAYILVGMAAPLTLAVFVLPRVLLAQGTHPYSVAIIRFALLESISTFGLVVLFLGPPLWLGLIPIVWGFLLTVLHIPGAHTLERLD